jgi:general stress protein 26
MSRQDHIGRVWEIIEKVGIAMLTTRFPGGLRARPLEARPERNAGVIWFVTDLRSGKEHEIETEHDVGLVFIDHKDKAYLSITGRAEVWRDHAKAAEIWRSNDNAWWHGPDDPNVCLLRVRPITAELWDGPASAAVAAFEFAKARVTGKKPNVGENRKVTVNMTSRNTLPRRSGAAAPPRRRPSAVYRIAGKQSEIASKSPSRTTALIARPSRTSWVTRPRERKPFSPIKSVARGRRDSGWRPRVAGAVSASTA